MQAASVFRPNQIQAQKITGPLYVRCPRHGNRALHRLPSASGGDPAADMAPSSRTRAARAHPVLFKKGVLVAPAPHAADPHFDPAHDDMDLAVEFRHELLNKADFSVSLAFVSCEARGVAWAYVASQNLRCTDSVSGVFQRGVRSHPRRSSFADHRYPSRLAHREKQKVV